MNFRIIFCSFIIGFLIFQQDTYAAVGDSVDPIACEIEQLLDPTVVCACSVGQTGTYPNCVTPQTCPLGQTGVYPNCMPTQSCLPGQTGTYPNCVTPQTCSLGQTGTYPNCVNRTCPAGQTGTYPNCVTPPSGSLAVTGFYGESLDMLYRGNDGSYSLDYDVLNRFFRAEGIAKYTSPQRVVRITTNRNQFYVQTPINTNGSWSVFDTTTPGYILSTFLQKGVNNLNVSYYDKNTKSYINNGVQKISITLY